MNANFWYGVAATVGVLCLVALAPLSNRYDNPDAIYREFQNLYLNVQPRAWTVYSSTPQLNQMQESEAVMVSTQANTGYIYFRLNNQVFKLKGDPQ